MNYERVENGNIISNNYSFSKFCSIISDRFSSLNTCPKELYVNFTLKFLESYSYFAISQLLVIYLHNEFGFTDFQAGTMYGLWGISITFWGLCASIFNDM